MTTNTPKTLYSFDSVNSQNRLFLVIDDLKSAAAFLIKSCSLLGTLCQKRIRDSEQITLLKIKNS